MTETEVIKILGKPLIVWNPNDKIVGFQHSKSYESSNYRIRQVHFENNVVTKIASEYYVD